jgi:hypothetical protein
MIMQAGEITSSPAADVLDGLGRFPKNLVLAPMTSLTLLTEKEEAS